MKKPLQGSGFIEGHFSYKIGIYTTTIGDKNRCAKNLKIYQK
jgi:hypothetical protein